MTQEQWNIFIQQVKELFTVFGVGATAVFVVYGGIAGWIKSKADIDKTKMETASLNVNTQTRKSIDAAELLAKISQINMDLLDNMKQQLDEAQAELRERDANDRLAIAKELAKSTQKSAEVMAQSIENIKAAVEETGKKADAAYYVANESNTKIQALQGAIAETLGLPNSAITASTGSPESKDDPNELSQQRQSEKGN
jgi:hypothetical protein